MADNTAIEWTDATWNPIVGCSVVSPGCTNCYAMRLAGTRLRHAESRKGLTHGSKAGPVWNGKLRLLEKSLDQPLRWRRPRRIFVCAHGDLFAENVPDEWIDRVFAVMALAPRHTFQVLTKRAERMRAYINGLPSSIPFLGRMPLERIHLEAAGHMEGDGGFMDTLKRHGNIYSLYCSVPWPLPNVWLGVSAEDQKRADERVPDLLATPAAIRFVSAEPLIQPIDFTRLKPSPEASSRYGGFPNLDALRGAWYVDGHRTDDAVAEPGFMALDWIIVGGESGPNARPMYADWARSIRDQCAAAGTAFFFKQWGEYLPVGQTLPGYGKVHGATAVKPGRMKLHYGGTPQHAPMHAFAKRGVEFASSNDGRLTFRTGRKAAGRLLDGIEHNAFPEV